MSVAFDVRLIGLDEAIESLMNLGRVDKRTALIQLAGVVESQTRRRIINEKTDPSGKTWVPWSLRYAKTRTGTHSMLRGGSEGGGLLESIGWSVQGDSAYVGTNSVYAATHQFGDASRNIPQRAFLGISAENESEITETLNNYLNTHINNI